MIKYKIIGITLFLIIVIFVVTLITYKTGIESVLLESEKIDSILVIRNDSISCITSKESITQAVSLLKKSTPIATPKAKLNTGQARICFYTKEGVKETLFIYCFYEGTVFRTNFKYYKNDELHDFFMNTLKSDFRIK